MIIGKVVGTVVSTSKHAKLHGLKLLIIRPYFEEDNGRFVAVDTVGAGVDQLVLVTHGESAANALSAGGPVDAAVVGIVDQEPETK